MENLTTQNSPSDNLREAHNDQPERSLFRYALPFAAPIISACLLIAAAQVPFMIEQGRTSVLVLLALILAAVNAGTAHYMSKTRRFGAPPTLLAIGGFGYLLLASNSLGRYLVIAGVVGLLAVFFTFLERRGIPDVNVSQPVSVDYGRLSLMMIVPAAFFLFAFGFALIEHQVLGRWPTTLMAATLTAFLAREVLRDLETESKSVRWLIGAVSLVGAQFVLALSYLPINHLVNAAVLAIILSLILQRAGDSQMSVRDESVFRRQAAFALLLIILILVTAQWL